MRELFIVFYFIALQIGFSQTDSLVIHYDIGEYLLKKKDTFLIKKYLKKLDSKTKYHIQINSSCDYLGSKHDNSILSTQRAETVRNLLMQEKNIIGATLQYKSLGELENNKNLINTRGVKNHRKTLITFLNEKKFLMNSIANSKKGEVFILEDIVFKPGMHFFKKKSIAAVKKLINILNTRPKMKLEISGHVCCGFNPKDSLDDMDLSTKKYELSKNRAKYVYNYLIKKNIDSSRLKYRGYGFAKPVFFPELNKEHKAKNRRVEIKILSN